MPPRAVGKVVKGKVSSFTPILPVNTHILLVQGKKGKKQAISEPSENLEDDLDLQNMDQNNAGLDQEQLTTEEKEAQILKTLNANNPQAPHNLTKFSYKERLFKTDDFVEQIVFHFSFDGDILLKDSEEHADQEEFRENKEKTNKGLLDKINVAIKEEFGKDPCKKTPNLRL